MKSTTLLQRTTGDQFYDVTTLVRQKLAEDLLVEPLQSGMLHLFLKHTSCALTINEAYDPKAATDMEKFLRHLAPENLSFIEHTDEGSDDSPSHMKAIITGHSLAIPVLSGQLQLGTWQGIYLCEFRKDPKERTILLTFQ